MWNIYVWSFWNISDVCGLFFVKAERHAEMKKSISYKVDVCVNIDWCIVQCEGEYSAGTGPYALCKHVSTMLFGLQKCSECGDIVTEETWTQNLQTFHHTKRYKGSHIQAKDVPLANQDLNVILNSDQKTFRMQLDNKTYTEMCG